MRPEPALCQAGFLVGERAAGRRGAQGNRWPAALHWVLLWLLLCLLAAALPARAETATLTLNATSGRESGWSTMRVLRLPESDTAPDAAAAPAMDAAQAWQRRDQFAAPTGPRGNLGPHRGTTWVHLPVHLDETAPATWTLSLGYPILQQVQLTVLDNQGRVLRTLEMGALVAHRDRLLPTRALAAPLQLQPGQTQHLMLRIVTPSAQLVDPVLMQPGELLADEGADLAFQGVMSGLWVFMMLTSLVTGLHRRQGVFLAYAGALLASWLFSLGIYGHGAVWFWPHSGWLAANMTVLAPALIIAANVQFFLRALNMRMYAPRTVLALHVISVLSLLTLPAFVLGLASYKPVAIACMLLGVLHLLLVVPAALAQRAAGDRGAGLVLLGCMTNLVGILGLTLLLRGHLPVNFLTLHLVQFTYALEMGCWLLALGVRLEELRAAAAAAQTERDTLRLLASTDPLTGLHNRRALDTALEVRLAAPQGAPEPGSAPTLALYLLDLDGFKGINDCWGHEAGDLLLREVAQRLREVARSGDIVARLGGDEFVLVSSQPADSARLDHIGRRLLAQFDRPFPLGEGRSCRVGATVGYAVAPLHGTSAAELLRAADTAMYAGKQRGRHTLVAAA